MRTRNAAACAGATMNSRGVCEKDSATICGCLSSSSSRTAGKPSIAHARAETLVSVMRRSRCSIAPVCDATAALSGADAHGRSTAIPRPPFPPIGGSDGAAATSGSVATSAETAKTVERMCMFDTTRRNGRMSLEEEGVPTASRASLLDELRAYVPADAREAAMRSRLVAFVAANPGAFERTLAAGHVTASAWIVDPARTRALLAHHRKLGRWLQPGGHVDGDPDVRGAALREAREESGLTSLRFVTDRIYDLDVHAIPARPGEPAHEHYDVRFALEADPAEPLVANAEAHALAWNALGDLPRYGADESVLRLARKTGRVAG